MSIQAVQVITIPIVLVACLQFVGQSVGICVLAIVKELVGPPNKARSCGRAELVWYVALTGNMIGLSAQGASLSSMIATTQGLLFFVFTLVDSRGMCVWGTPTLLLTTCPTTELFVSHRDLEEWSGW
jgi:hypothetical protein